MPKIALTRILPQAADQKALNTMPSQLSLMDPLVLSLTSKVSQFILRHMMYKDMIVMTMIFWLALFSIISFGEDTVKNSMQLLQDTVSYPQKLKKKKILQDTVSRSLLQYTLFFQIYLRYRAIKKTFFGRYLYLKMKGLSGQSDQSEQVSKKK